ncbi:MAG: thymidine phosphorylase [Actinomycetota bacterium]|nr:thymidine phosphorylase [Actinomycetota bacterium]
MTVRDPRTIVATKRDGRSLAPADIQVFVNGFLRGEISDALAAAFLMACATRGLDPEETLALTRVMIASGETVSFTGLGRSTVDKHSTGGVADGVTLIFAPLAAALGLAVAKLSGRALGHTGGTLDKLESIPGFRTQLSADEIERQAAEVGCVIAAQSATLVPADAALYALRDATATVESIPLIAASVMSKKLAVQTDLILLDVKVGSGAFMKTPEEATALAEECLSLARAFDRPARAAVTDMSQPLGDAVGNALEVAEAVEVLRGARRGRLRELAVAFAARALDVLEGLARDDAVRLAERALDDGRAAERFRAMVSAQGGDERVLDDPWAVLPRAPVVRAILAERAGSLAGVDAEVIGRASAALGASGSKKGDRVDPAVGIVVRSKVGDHVDREEKVGEVHARDEASAHEAASRVVAAMTFSEQEVAPPSLVHGWLA